MFQDQIAVITVSTLDIGKYITEKFKKIVYLSVRLTNSSTTTLSVIFQKKKHYAVLQKNHCRALKSGLSHQQPLLMEV